MTDIDVSVITPTFNRADLLPRVWQSLKEQKASFEWIVVDDGSTDNTAQVIRELSDSRVVYVALPENCGVNVARNRGVALVHGRYVVFLDSDDELYPESLSVMVDVMNNAPQHIGAAAFACVMAATGKQVSRFPDGIILNEDDIVCKQLLSVGDKIYVYLREVFTYFMLPEQLQGCEHLFVYAIAKKWDFLIVNKPLSIVHRQTDNLSNANSLIARSYDIAKSYECLIDNHAEILANNRSAYINYLKKALYRYCVSGHYGDAWRTYKQLLNKSGSFAEISLATGMLAMSFAGAKRFEKWRIDRLNRKLLGLNE